MKKMNSDYNYLFEEFPEQKIQDRYYYIHAKMQEFIQFYKLDNVEINDSILGYAILDYFADIYRLKDFHNIEKINKRKILSYEAFWILKRKPLQIIKKDTVSDDISIFVNEYFVMTFLSQDFFKENTHSIHENDERIMGEYLKHLFYHLKYRHIDQQSIELLLFSFELGRKLNSSHK